MVFREMGNSASPAVLLIHGMLSDADDSLSYGKYLSDEYYVLCPTLDGHGNDGSTLVSGGDEAEKIVSFLEEKGIERLSLLQGCSMGAEVALAVLSECGRRGIYVEKAFFDGGPFFDFSPLFRKFMELVFTSLIARVGKSSSPEELTSHPFVKFVGGKKADAFMPMMSKVVRKKIHYTKSSVRGMVETCYHCILQKLDEDVQRRCMFFFSLEEPARKSRKRLRQAYPKARYMSIKGYPHCGLMINRPQKYADVLRSFMSLSV